MHVHRYLIKMFGFKKRLYIQVCDKEKNIFYYKTMNTIIIIVNETNYYGHTYFFFNSAT